jgi:uncharacterized protein YjiS (DUF1127 family)
MIPLYSMFEQRVPGATTATGYRKPLTALALRMAFNCRRWLRNRRELRGLDREQLRDVGLSREAVEQACRLNLLRK